MRHLVLYLAGDISKLEPWRARVIEACDGLSITFYSPVESTTYTPQSLSSQHKKHRTFVIEDYIKIDWSDIVFAYFRKGSKSQYSGTSTEVERAKCRGKYVIGVFEGVREYKYPFPYKNCDEVFKSLDEAIDALKDMAVNMHYQPKGE